jgi:hypothetical protein
MYMQVLNNPRWRLQLKSFANPSRMLRYKHEASRATSPASDSDWAQVRPESEPLGLK